MRTKLRRSPSAVSVVNRATEAPVRPPLSVKDGATVLDTLNLFKREPAEMAFVVDGRGAFLGIVTREDLLEAIAGDLPDARSAQPGAVR